MVHERPNLGLGHTADCPHFETRWPWQCDCQVRARDLALAAMGEPEDSLMLGGCGGACDAEDSNFY